MTINNKKSYLAIGYDDDMNFDYEMELKEYCKFNNKRSTPYDLEKKFKKWFDRNNPDIVSLSSGIDSNLALSLILDKKKPKIIHFGAYGEKGSEYNYVKKIVKKLDIENCLVPIKEYDLDELLDYFITSSIIPAIDNLVAFNEMFKQAKMVFGDGGGR